MVRTKSREDQLQTDEVTKDEHAWIHCRRFSISVARIVWRVGITTKGVVGRFTRAGAAGGVQSAEARRVQGDLHEGVHH